MMLTVVSLLDGRLEALADAGALGHPAFRQALRSEIPCNRITAAAALAIVDQTWSRAELSGVLDESDNHERTAECRSALMTTHSQEAHRKVREWEARYPRMPEEGPSITLKEVGLRMSDETVNCEMETLHDRALPLKGTAVSPAPRPWWRLGG